MKRLGGNPSSWQWNLMKETTYPSGGLVFRCSSGSAIHSGRVEEVRGRRSPSFSKSCNRRSITIDGRHSSAMISLTGIF